jgi:hypothetical protein
MKRLAILLLGGAALVGALPSRLAADATVPDRLAAPAPKAAGHDSLTTPAPQTDQPLVIYAVRRGGPITVDGQLSEPVWASAPPCTAFVQRVPRERAPASQRTEVHVLYDDDALYVGAWMADAAPESILARLARRDASTASDRFAVYLDPYHDRRSGYYFMVNAAGTLFDGTLSNDNADDKAWDGVWQGRARIGRDGWAVEMRIPWTQLRSQPGPGRVWGINFGRSIPHRHEEDYVVFRPRKESGFVSRFPDLVGLEGISRGHGIELWPYVTTESQLVAHDPGDPFHDGTNVHSDAGGDLRLGLGPGMTLNGTFRPDFGQVEVDPAVVNLTDVETFLDEKRPFFVEGASIFDFGRQGSGDYWDYSWDDPLFFYSRRIGRAPQGKAPKATYSDVPEGARILGALKLIGRPASGWTLGTLHAVTDRTMARLAGPVDPWESEIEPLTYYGVLRTQREMAARRAGIGVLATATARSFDELRLASQLPRSALLGGLDGWLFLDRRRTWVVSGWSAASRVDGDPTPLVKLQRSSTHYFQRPGTDYLSVDSSATSLSGWGSRYWLNKEKGALQFNAAVGTVSPGFDVNDLGYEKQADLLNAHIGTGYKWSRPGRVRRYQSIKAAVFGNWNYGGNALAHGVQASGYTETNGGQIWDYYGGFQPSHLNDRRTRGGPLMIDPASWFAGGDFQTDTQHPLYFYANVSGSQSASGSWGASAYPAVEWKPASTFSLKIGPGWERVHENAQYVTAFADPTATGTYGRRYVFALLDQTTVSASARLDWTFTPRLSFETFVQPYLSAATYRDYRSLAEARSDHLEPFDYAGPSPDFNVRSLKGDAVLRWEYMPGSVLFLVWTQQRAEEDPSGAFDLPASFQRLGGLRPENVYLVKLSYYFTP